MEDVEHLMYITNALNENHSIYTRVTNIPHNLHKKDLPFKDLFHLKQAEETELSAKVWFDSPSNSGAKSCKAKNFAIDSRP